MIQMNRVKDANKAEDLASRDLEQQCQLRQVRGVTRRPGYTETGYKRHDGLDNIVAAIGIHTYDGEGPMTPVSTHWGRPVYMH